MPAHKHKDRKNKEKYLWYYEFQYLGKRRKKSGFLSRPEAEKAEQEEKERIRRIENGEYELDEDFNYYFKNWLDNRRDINENTQYTYQVIYRNHIEPFFKDYQVNNVKPIDIKNFIDYIYQKGLSSSSIKKGYNAINKMYNQLHKMRMIQYNPCNGIDKPTEESEKIEVFDEKELVEFLNFAQDYSRYAIAFRLAAYTGMRRGEILALQWGKVDLENKIITINRKVVRAAIGTDRYVQEGTKTIKERRIAISDRLIQDIINHKEIQRMERETNKYNDMNLVIATQHGNVVSPDNMTRIFRNTLKASPVDKKLSFHALRHTHATLMLKKNIPMKVISERLGHSSIKTTMDKYSHLLPSMDKEAVEKFDELFEE